MTSQINENKIYYQFGARRVNLYHPKDGLIGSREFSNAPGHGETMTYKGKTHKLVHLKHGAKMEESADPAEIISQLQDIIGESKGFFSYKAPEPEKDAPKGTRMTRKEWEQLSPGMRREISRQAKKKPFGESTKDRAMNENTKFPVHATKRRVNDAIKRGIESGKITPDEAKSMKLVHHSGELHGLIGHRGNGTDYESVTFHHWGDKKTPFRHVMGPRETVKSGSHFDRFKKPFTFGANMDESFDDEYELALEEVMMDEGVRKALANAGHVVAGTYHFSRAAGLKRKMANREVDKDVFGSSQHTRKSALRAGRYNYHVNRSKYHAGQLQMEETDPEFDEAYEQALDEIISSGDK